MKMTIVYFVLSVNLLLVNGYNQLLGTKSKTESPVLNDAFNQLDSESQTSINKIANNENVSIMNFATVSFALITNLLFTKELGLYSYSVLLQDLLDIKLQCSIPKVLLKLLVSAAVSEGAISGFSKAFEDCNFCYQRYGCLQIGGPFIAPSRPISLPPYPPKFFPIEMHLYTRNNPNDPFIFRDLTNIDQIHKSSFIENAPTTFLIGGFLGGDGKYLVDPFVPQLLANSDSNVFNVNWSLSSRTIYAQAIANCRLVGVVIGNFIQLLHKKTGLSYSQCHLIGHSLGAHAAGYAGQYLDGKIGRISGLDPAGPCFNGTDPIVRLDPTDAQFVDNIHSDGGSLSNLKFGIDQSCGHVDFWPNNGKVQPNCTSNFNYDIGFISQVIGTNNICSHGRSVEYYAESIPTPNNPNSCKFRAHPCSSYSAYKCGQCSNDYNALEMGFNSVAYTEGKIAPYPVALQGYYLDTNGYHPFCQTSTVFNYC